MRKFHKNNKLYFINNAIKFENSIEINQIYHKSKVVLKIQKLYHVYKNHGKTHNNDRDYFI